MLSERLKWLDSYKFFHTQARQCVGWSDEVVSLFNKGLSEDLEVIMLLIKSIQKLLTEPEQKLEVKSIAVKPQESWSMQFHKEHEEFDAEIFSLQRAYARYQSSGKNAADKNRLLECCVNALHVLSSGVERIWDALIDTKEFSEITLKRKLDVLFDEKEPKQQFYFMTFAMNCYSTVNMAHHSFDQAGERLYQQIATIEKEFSQTYSQTYLHSFANTVSAIWNSLGIQAKSVVIQKQSVSEGDTVPKYEPDSAEDEDFVIVNSSPVEQEQAILRPS